MKGKIVIGIDPDVDANGYACVDTQEHAVFCACYDFVPLLDKIQEEYNKAIQNEKEFVVCVEGGWLTKKNWHITQYMSVSKAGELGRALGRNHQRGIDILEYCQGRNIPCQAIVPLIKYWKTDDGKISHDQIKQMLSLSKISNNIKGRSNPELRDATLIALVHSGLPLRVPTSTICSSKRAKK